MIYIVFLTVIYAILGREFIRPRITARVRKGLSRELRREINGIEEHEHEEEEEDLGLYNENNQGEETNQNRDEKTMELKSLASIL